MAKHHLRNSGLIWRAELGNKLYSNFSATLKICRFKQRGRWPKSVHENYVRAIVCYSSPSSRPQNVGNVCWRITIWMDEADYHLSTNTLIDRIFGYCFKCVTKPI